MALSVPSGGLSIGSAAFDISSASRDNPVTVTIGDGGELAGGSSAMVLSAGSLPEMSPAAYMALSNEVPDGYAAQFTTVGTAIYVNVVSVKWIEENAAKTYLTGRWSEDVEYGADGKANIVGGNVFTPYSASTGNVVTIETNCVSKILFSGETYFTSLAGESVSVEGFVEHETIALAGASVTIDKARAAWLNGLGARAEVSGALSRLTAEKFNEAYLLNFDVTKGDFTYEFKVTGITVDDARVSIEVTLSRSGEAGGEINGTLNFYGAATLEAFKSAPSKLGTAELSNESFGDGDTARAAIELKGETPPAFFDARIE